MSSQLNISETIQSMIDCNAGMVFNYTYSQPELKRIAHPIMIVGKHVLCMESDNGLYKRFKLDGIQFPKENTIEHSLSDDFKCMVKINGKAVDEYHRQTNLDLIKDCIENNKTFIFTYNNSRPEYVRKVIPEKLVENRKFIGFDLDSGSYKSFYIPHINPITIKKEEEFVNECEGCRNNCPGQRDHMGFNGCLYSDEQYF
jgi:hypothetical protein